jgi:hypothetical protein
VLLHVAGSDIEKLADADLSVLKNFWNNLVMASIPADASVPQVLNAVIGSLPGGSILTKKVLTDNGIEVTIQPRWLLDQPKQGRCLAITAITDSGKKMPASIISYLKTLDVVYKEIVTSSSAETSTTDSNKPVSFGQVPVLDASLDRKAFVRNLLRIASINYQENATVNFEYAGIQIQAITNALNRPDGLLVLVDFHDLQGEAINTIEKAGFELFQVPQEGENVDVLPKLLGTAGLACENNPTFAATERTGPDNTFISLPGYLSRKEGTPTLLFTTAAVPDELIKFFYEKEIAVVFIENSNTE